LLCYDFKKADQDKTGLIPLAQFKKIIRASRLMTPKEKNLMIRSILETKVNYSNFPDMLNKTRFEIASSRLMETAIDTLEEELMLLFTQADKN
jgi:Ca2+-binding EF-hand superfamily protein